MNLKTLKLPVVAILIALAITPAVVVAGPSDSADAGYSKIPPGVEFKVVGDAGVPVVPAKKFEPTERRDELRVFTEVMRNALSDQLKTKVGLKPILFAEQYNETKDAAIVTFVTDDKETANFFFYGNGKWNIFPADFSALPTK